MPELDVPDDLLREVWLWRDDQEQKANRRATIIENENESESSSSSSSSSDSGSAAEGEADDSDFDVRDDELRQSGQNNKGKKKKMQLDC